MNRYGSVLKVNLLVFVAFIPGIRKNENGVPEEEENFDEAIKSVNSSLNATGVSTENCFCSFFSEMLKCIQCL